MPRAKKARTEIIRVAPQMDLETLDALIQKRVAEATASRGAILEPWFQSPAISAEIRRHQSMFQQRKWSLFFERWGCMVCGTKKEPHDTHGMCVACFNRLTARLAVIQKEYAKAHPREVATQNVNDLTRRVRSAEQILLGESAK